MNRIFYSLLWFSLLAIAVVSFTSAFTDQERQNICLQLNLTLSPCFEFWQYYDSYNNGTLNNTIIVYQNQTVYVNQTVNSTLYDVSEDAAFQERQAQRDHEFRLAELDARPQFDFNASLTNYYTKSEIDTKFSEVYVKIQEIAAPVVKKAADNKYYLLIVAVLLFVGFFTYKKFFDKPKRDRFYEGSELDEFPHQYKPLPVMQGHPHSEKIHSEKQGANPPGDIQNSGSVQQ